MLEAPREGSIVIRRAVPADASAIAAVLRVAFSAYASLYTPRAFAATTPSARAVRARIGEGPVWVAAQGGALVATASAVVTDRGCYIRGMAVVPGARGQRLGWRLLEAVEGFARAEALPRLYLSTTPFLDRAIALYERYGFHRTDDGPFDLFGTPLFTMVKAL